MSRLLSIRKIYKQSVLTSVLLLSSHHVFPQSAVTFDCRDAKASAEIAICQDNDLIKLDRTLADVFKDVSEKSTAAGKQRLRSYQQGWIKGRNDCWKSSQVKTCIKESYQARIIELEIEGGLKPSAIVTFVCNGDNAQQLKTTFYEADISAAKIDYMNDKVFAFSLPVANGIKYAAIDVEFLGYQKEATVKWFGKTLKCLPIKPAAAK